MRVSTPSSWDSRITREKDTFLFVTKIIWRTRICHAGINVEPLCGMLKSKVERLVHTLFCISIQTHYIITQYVNTCVPYIFETTFNVLICISLLCSITNMLACRFNAQDKPTHSALTHFFQDLGILNCINSRICPNV